LYFYIIMSKYVLLVDDDNTMRKSLSFYLSDQGFLVKSFKDVNSALLSLKKKIPDVIISDILMPTNNGYNLIKFLKKNSKYSTILFIFLTAKGMTHDRIMGYNLGCHAYLTKPFDPEELVSIMRNLLTNFRLFKIKYNSYSHWRTIPSHSYQFTYRERTILKLVLQGMMNKEIALQLSLSLRNVEKYVSRLLLKTKTRNRTELAKHFLSLNFCPVEGE
jgi:DNA-binding NarL/FixJ family response regulator